MKFSIDAHLGSNITVVLDALDLAHVSRDKIKAGVSEVALMDLPEFIVVMAPPGIVIQMADRRVVVSDQTRRAPGEIDLWSPTVTAVEAVDQPKVVAYGFNYDLSLTLDDVTEAGAYLTKAFLPTAEALQRSLDVRDLSAMPRLVYFRDSIRYDLRLEAKEGRQLQVHLNAHFARQSLPQTDLLRGAFKAEYGEVGRLLGAL